jgi:hypothetical protein
MPSDKATVKRHVQEMARILSDPNFAEALGELAEDENAGGRGAVAEAQRDPHGFFRARNVQHVPPDARVTVEAASPLRITICLNDWCGSWEW